MMFSTCRTVSSDWLSIADGVKPPIWGVAMTFGSIANSRDGIWSPRAADIHRGSRDAAFTERR